MRRMVTVLALGLVCLMALTGCSAAASVQAQAIHAVVAESSPEPVAFEINYLRQVLSNTKIAFSPSLQPANFKNFLVLNEKLLVYHNVSRDLKIEMTLYQEGEKFYIHVEGSHAGQSQKGIDERRMDEWGIFEVYLANQPVQFEAPFDGSIIYFTLPPEN